MGKEGSGRIGRVHVAAFGKHPGWDDHIEEIGLDCDALVRAKRELYTEGLAGNIDSGAWERLPEGQDLGGFRHQFYWRVPDGLIIGRMWASKDGKGRTKYPMVVCALVEGVPMAWAMQHVLPRLEQIEAKCAQTASAELVRLAIGEARRGLEDEVTLLVGSGSTVAGPDDAAVLKKLVEHPALSLAAPEGEKLGLVRVLYEIDREMAGYRPVGGMTRTRSRIAGDSTAQHVRVPRCLDGPGEGARGWFTLLAQEIADSVPVLILEPAGTEWLDVVVGEPKASHLFCVRASRQALAPTTEVPYTIEPGFRQAALERAAGWARGEVRRTAASAVNLGAALEGEVNVAGIGATSKRTLLVGVGLGLILIAAILVAVFAGGDKPPPRADTEPDNTTQPPPVQTNSSTNGKSAPVVTPVAPAPSSEPLPVYAEGDPRSGWAFEDHLAQARAILDRRDRELQAEGKAPEAAQRQKLDRAAERVKKFILPTTYTPAARDGLVKDMASVDADLRDAVRAAESQLAETTARVRVFLDDEAAKPQVSTDPMKSAWTSAMRGIDAEAGWQNARQKAAAMAAALKDAETGVGAAVRMVYPPLREADAGALQEAEASRRDAALRAASDAVIAGDAAKAKEATAAFAARGAEAQKVLESAAEVERLLALGYGLDEPAPGGRTIAGAITDMKAAPVWKELGNALAPLPARAEALRALAGEKDPAKLTAALREARTDASRVRATETMLAWSALAALGWPDTPADLAAAGPKLTEDVFPVLERVPDPARAEVLRSAAHAKSRAMWTGFVQRRGTDDAALDAARKAVEPMIVTPVEMKALPTWAQYNLWRHGLAQSLAEAAKLAGTPRDQAQRDAMARFSAMVNGLDVAASGTPAALLAEIKQLSDKGAKLELAKLGPGGRGWAFLEGPDPDAAVYKWKAPSGTDHTLEFRKVSIDASDEVSFVATTEASVGLFMDAVAGSSTWNDVRGMLPPPPPESGGPPLRGGAHTWVWVRGGQISPSPSKGAGDLSGGWVRIETKMSHQPYYPPGVTAEPPCATSPMQQLPLQAAVLAARSLGCRIPSSAEWKAAKVSDTATAHNLRDGTWAKVYNHLLQNVANSPEFPAAGIFYPSGTKGPQPGADGAPAVEGEDGWIWFWPVTTGTGTFKSLVGNVAEFIFEEPALLEGLAPTQADIERVLGRSDKLGVVGGSALSPKTVRPDEVYVLSGKDRKESYSDVGFRVAFSAPRAAGAAGMGELLKKALDASGYLPAR